MSFLKKQNEKILRIEDRKGSSATLMIDASAGTGQLLSILVPEKERRKALGTKILAAAEAEAYEKGTTQLQAYYSNTLSEVSALLSGAGYEVSEDGTLFSVKTEELLSSKAVRKTLENSTNTAIYLRFEEMNLNEMREVEALLSGFDLGEEILDLYAYSKTFSGVVYTQALVIKAVILCTEEKGAVRIDLFFGNTRKEPEYLMAALRGMLLALSEDTEKFPVIRLAAVNEMTLPLLSRVLDKGYSAKQEGAILRAEKTLSAGTMKETVTADEGLDEEGWLDEVEEIPFQNNISWKAFWQRNRFEKKKDEVHFK